MTLRHEQRGSAAVEFAAVLPLLAVAVLFVAQAALVVWDQLRITHAAREGARVLAVTNDASQARDAAIAAAVLPEDRTEVEVAPEDRPVGTPAYVRVQFTVPIIVPFVGGFLDGFTLSSAVWMRVERDPP